jgi:hypothetical protein
MVVEESPQPIRERGTAELLEVITRRAQHTQNCLPLFICFVGALFFSHRLSRPLFLSVSDFVCFFFYFTKLVIPAQESTEDLLENVGQLHGPEHNSNSKSDFHSNTGSGGGVGDDDAGNHYGGGGGGGGGYSSDGNHSSGGGSGNHSGNEGGDDSDLESPYVRSHHCCAQHWLVSFCVCPRRTALCPCVCVQTSHHSCAQHSRVSFCVCAWCTAL